MFEVDPSGVDINLGSISWFFVEMTSSVDSPTHELDAELFLRFQAEISRKLFELDLGWFYNFKLTCWRKLVKLDHGWFYDSKLKIKDVESLPINSWPWLWIDFMILS